jgi:hypothetical protein
VISLAIQLDHLGQFNGLGSVDSEMQSLAYKNDEVRHLAWLAEDHLLTSMATLPVGNASSAKMSSGFQTLSVHGVGFR